MEKILIPLIGKRITLNGQTMYGRPSSGWKQRLYDKLVTSSFEKQHKRIKGFPIDKLDEILEDISKHFESDNHAFLTNVYSNQWDGIQIIHPYMNHDKIANRAQEFGFSIYFTFDYSFEQQRQLHRKFLEANFDDLKSFVHDELVRCYDLNCGKDKIKVFNTVKRYYTDVLGYNDDVLYYFDTSSHGKIEHESIE